MLRSEEINLVELQVEKARRLFRLAEDTCVDLPKLLMREGVQTIFKELSESVDGMSIKAPGGRRFMLINRCKPLGRQNFTIAHELYHLYIEEDPKPHVTYLGNKKEPSEKRADMFASRLLMPAPAVRSMLSDPEIRNGAIGINTLLRLTEYFGTSREAMLYRLKTLSLITATTFEQLKNVNVSRLAANFGLTPNPFTPTEKDYIIGDLDTRLEEAFDHGLISEGHKNEILNAI